MLILLPLRKSSLPLAGSVGVRKFRRYVSMPLTKVQQGLIAQQEFAKLLMMGSHGRIELAAPVTDDERRDFEVHVRGQYGFGLAIQVKSTTALHRQGGHAHYLHSYFLVRATRLVNNPLYWYFFAYLDPRLMRFADPVFLIPSKDFHEHATPRRSGAFWYFTFVANLKPGSGDRWAPFRVSTLELGERVLEIMNDLKKHRDRTLSLASVLTAPDALWIREASARASTRRKPDRVA